VENKGGEVSLRQRNVSIRKKGDHRAADCPLIAAPMPFVRERNRSGKKRRLGSEADEEKAW